MFNFNFSPFAIQQAKKAEEREGLKRYCFSDAHYKEVLKVADKYHLDIPYMKKLILLGLDFFNPEQVEWIEKGDPEEYLRTIFTNHVSDLKQQINEMSKDRYILVKSKEDDSILYLSDCSSLSPKQQETFRAWLISHYKDKYNIAIYTNWDGEYDIYFIDDPVEIQKALFDFDQQKNLVSFQTVSVDGEAYIPESVIVDAKEYEDLKKFRSDMHGKWVMNTEPPIGVTEFKRIGFSIADEPSIVEGDNGTSWKVIGLNLAERKTTIREISTGTVKQVDFIFYRVNPDATVSFTQPVYNFIDSIPESIQTIDFHTITRKFRVTFKDGKPADIVGEDEIGDYLAGRY